MMKRLVFRIAAALLAAGTLFLGACATPPSNTFAENHSASPAPGTIRFLTRFQLPLAEAQINGADVGYFLIDTGSSSTILDRRTADQFHLPVVRRQTINGIGGSVEATIVRIKRLALGGREWGSKEAGVVDMTVFNKSIGWPVAGILGLDSLAGQIFTLDLQSGTLVLEDRATFTPPSGAVVQQVEMVGGLPAVQGRIEGHDAIFQIDSGSNDSLSIWIGQFNDHPDMLAGKTNVESQSAGVGGRAGTVKSQLRDVEVFGRHLGEVPFHIEMNDPRNAPALPGGPVIGRMGNDLLKRFRLTFDTTNHRLWAVVR